MKKLLSMLLALLSCFAPCVALADTSFDGSVVSGGAVSVRAPFGGVVSSVSVQAGDRVEVGDVVAEVETIKVYAPEAGTVAGLFVQTGDNAETVAARYGASLPTASIPSPPTSRRPTTTAPTNTSTSAKRSTSPVPRTATTPPLA